MNTDLDTLATAVYVRTDDLLNAHPEWLPPRPRVGITPRISDAELITRAVIAALRGFHDEARFVRHARRHLSHLFPYVPGQAGYNKRLRKLAATMRHVAAGLAAETSLVHDGVWLINSTPVECGRSRQIQQRSRLAGWANCGYSASHSRFFLGAAAASDRHPCWAAADLGVG